MKNNFLRKKSLTLIEMLLVTAILPIVSLVIYATFSSGIRIYQKTIKSLPQEEINLFLTHLYEDLRNSFNFKTIPFEADRDSLSFATLFYDARFKAKIPAEVSYKYDPYRKIFLRQYLIYPEIFSSSEPIKSATLENVDNFTFRYYYYNQENNTYIWEDRAISKKIPLAVKVEFEVIHNGGRLPLVYIVSLPAGE